jgi:hypothetical protein
MFGVGSEISAQVVESEAWDYLDAPIERVTGAGTSSFLRTFPATLVFLTDRRSLSYLSLVVWGACRSPHPIRCQPRDFRFPRQRGHLQGYASSSLIIRAASTLRRADSRFVLSSPFETQLSSERFVSYFLPHHPSPICYLRLSC